MIYYLLLLIVICLTYILICKVIKPKNANILFLDIAFIEMLSFLGLRDVKVGHDLQNYIPYFHLFKTSGWNIVISNVGIENGYILFNKIIGLIGGENLFLFITSIVCLIGVYYSIKKYSNNYLLSIYIYITLQFYIFLFSGLRQAIAFSIVWISLKFIKERKFYKFILLILIALTFHKTAIFVIPMYFFANKKITKRYLIIMATIFLLLLIFKNQIFYIVTKFIFTQYQYSNDGGYKFLALLILILGFSLYICYKNKEKLMENNMWINMLIISILIQSLASVQGNIARLTMYYSYSIIFLIPNIIIGLKNKKIRIIAQVILYGLLFVYYVISIQNQSIYIPYETFLF